MGSPDFDDPLPCPGFFEKRPVQVLEGGHQLMMQLLHRGDVHGRRERIVGRLAAVAVIVGMDRRF